jgi:cytosine permease
MEKQSPLFPWSKVAPTLGVIFVSPAILAVGCTLGTMLPLAFAVLTSVVSGVCISLFIYFHGGIGAAEHKPFTKIMEASLGERGSRFLASPLITVTQVGWFAVLIGLGGQAASALTGLNSFITITVFGVAIAGVTYSGFGRLSDFTKITAILTGIFAIWSLYSIMMEGPSFLPTPSSPDYILMAAGLAIGGATSISTVSPDFMMRSSSLRDVKITAFGVVLPLILFTMISGNIMGSFTTSPNPVLALIVIGLPVLANLLLLMGSCAAASSLYPPSLALANLLRVERRFATLPAAAAGLVLANIGIVEQLNYFLRAIGILLPPLMGMSLAEYYFISRHRLEGRAGTVWSGVLSWAIGACVGLIPLWIPPINALLSSLIAYWALNLKRKQARG